MPQSRIELLEDAIDNLIIDLDIINQIVNGDENTEVQTDSGPVSSLKKAIGDLENTARRLRDEAETFRNEASDIKDETEGLSFNAAVSENNAKDSADKALNSSNDAEDSYVAAYNSANDAQTSATAASSSAAAAQASLEEFQGIYHGRLSGGATPTDPEIGDMYFNEDKDRMEVLTTAGWVPTASAQLSPEDFYEKVEGVDINDNNISVVNDGISPGIEVVNTGGLFVRGVYVHNNKDGNGIDVENVSDGDGVRILNDADGNGISVINMVDGDGIYVNTRGKGPALRINQTYSSTGSLIENDNFTVDKYGAIHQPFLYWGNATGTTVLRGNFSDFFQRANFENNVINYNIRMTFESDPYSLEGFSILINDIGQAAGTFFVDLNVGDYFEFRNTAGGLGQPADIIIKVLSIT